MNDNHLRSQILPETEKFSNSETLAIFEDKMDMSYKKPVSRHPYGAPSPPHSPLSLNGVPMEHVPAANRPHVSHGYHHLCDPGSAAAARVDNGSMQNQHLLGSTMPHSGSGYATAKDAMSNTIRITHKRVGGVGDTSIAYVEYDPDFGFSRHHSTTTPPKTTPRSRTRTTTTEVDVVAGTPIANASNECSCTLQMKTTSSRTRKSASYRRSHTAYSPTRMNNSQPPAAMNHVGDGGGCCTPIANARNLAANASSCELNTRPPKHAGGGSTPIANARNLVANAPTRMNNTQPPDAMNHVVGGGGCTPIANVPLTHGGDTPIASSIASPYGKWHPHNNSSFSPGPPPPCPSVPPHHIHHSSPASNDIIVAPPNGTRAIDNIDSPSSNDDKEPSGRCFDHIYQMRTQGHDKTPSMGQGGGVAMPRYDGPEMQQAPCNGARYEYASHNPGRYERIGGRPQHLMTPAAYGGYWGGDEESIAAQQKLSVTGPVVGRLYHQQLYNKGKKIIESMGTPAPPRNKDNSAFSSPTDASNASNASLPFEENGLASNASNAPCPSQDHQSTPGGGESKENVNVSQAESSILNDAAPTPTLTTPAPPTTLHSELFLPTPSNASSHDGSTTEYEGNSDDLAGVTLSSLRSTMSMSRSGVCAGRVSTHEENEGGYDDKCNDAGTPPHHGSSSTRSNADERRQTSASHFLANNAPSNADEIPSISIYSIEEVMLGRGGDEHTPSRATQSSPRRSATAGQPSHAESPLGPSVINLPSTHKNITGRSTSGEEVPTSLPPTQHHDESASLNTGILDHRFLLVPRNNPHPRLNRIPPVAPKKAPSCPSALTTSTSSSPSLPIALSSSDGTGHNTAHSDAASERVSESTESTEADCRNPLDVVYGGADEDCALAHLLADDDDDFGGSDFRSIASECESDASGDEILFGVSRPM